MQKLNVQKPDFLSLLKEHINLSALIPQEFRKAYYKNTGKPRDHKLESMLWFGQLQNFIGVKDDAAMLRVLQLSSELREFCGFVNVPDAYCISTFRKDFAEYLGLLFEHLVEVTEPICRAIDPKKADYLLYDPTGIKAKVSENNPKFMNMKLDQAKKIAKNNPDYDPYKGVYSLLPDTAKANPFLKRQHINGHFCYAHKVGILTNGIGIVRGLYLFDDRFRAKHPDIVERKTDNPDLDKEIGDSTSLKPVLSDFFHAHPSFLYKTFIADSSFDSYDNYTMLKHDFHFDRICIPLNPRNSASAHNDFDKNGTPVCPIDKTPFTYLGVSGGKNRSKRLKFVCHKSIKIKGTTKRICTCDTPCTTKPYGRCVYTYPDKNLRLYPGIIRGTEHWDNLYRHRTLIERTIFIFKDSFGIAHRRSFSAASAKADLFNAGITQLLGLIFAVSINNSKFFKSVRRLFSA